MKRYFHSRIQYDRSVDARTGLESEMSRTIGISSHLPRHVVNCVRLLAFTHDISKSSFQIVHDFFKTQPVQNAAVFLLRAVLHDWPNEFARQILLQLREAATSDTKLLIADFVLPNWHVQMIQARLAI